LQAVEPPATLPQSERGRHSGSSTVALPWPEISHCLQSPFGERSPLEGAADGESLCCPPCATGCRRRGGSGPPPWRAAPVGTLPRPLRRLAPAERAREACPPLCRRPALRSA